MKKNKRSKKITHPRPRARTAPRQSRHAPHGATATAVGVFHGTRRGFGFVTAEGVTGDIFIPAAQTGGALDGDRVEVRYRAAFRTDTEGAVTAVLEPREELCIGVYITDRVRNGRRTYARRVVIPDDRRLPEAIPVLELPDAENGDKVEARLDRRHGLGCRVLRSFGSAASFEANYESILAECGIEREFAPEVLAEASARAAAPLSEEGRVRQTGPILTIDGADAKDLDDAVSLKRIEGGYLLSVHIADVSEYVLPKTPLDRAAMQRGTSVYFVDQVVPMLPPALSNGACSLNPNEDKYALTAHMTLDGDGALTETRVERSIIRSDVRGVYGEVNDLLDRGDASPYAEKYAAVRPMLLLMRELYEKLANRARQRGYTDFEAAEPYFVLDEAGKPVDILPRERGVSERIIEHFMLTANEGVARLLTERGLPCVYRVHEAPPEDKLTEFTRYAHNLGLSAAPLTRRPLSPTALSALLREAEEKGLGAAVSRRMVRAMAKARYSEQRADHFGLGLTHYCHFTSPIRRLPDLATHRIIKACLLDGRPPAPYAAYAKRAAAAACETELSALQAERQIEALYKALWAEGHVGERFSATVSGLTSFGIFAELDNTVEGLIPMDTLPFGAFCDEEAEVIRVGDEVFRTADRIRIRIEEAEPAARRIRFSLLSE